MIAAVGIVAAGLLLLAVEAAATIAYVRLADARDRRAGRRP